MKNPINESLKGYRNLGFNCSLSNVSQYIISLGLPRSMITLLISQSNTCTVINMRSSLWGNIHATSQFEKPNSGRDVSFTPNSDSKICITWHAYILREELNSSPFTNPLTMVLRVCPICLASSSYLFHLDGGSLIDSFWVVASFLMRYEKFLPCIFLYEFPKIKIQILA